MVTLCSLLRGQFIFVKAQRKSTPLCTVKLEQLHSACFSAVKLFNFKIRVIFVKRWRSIFFDLTLLFLWASKKAWDSLLDVAWFPYCNLMCCQLCALRAPFLFRARFTARHNSPSWAACLRAFAFQRTPAYHWGTADNLFTTKSSQVARLKLLGSVYLIGSLPAALYKFFIFNFKVSIIFVKLLRHIFSILQYYFAMRE